MKDDFDNEKDLEHAIDYVEAEGRQFRSMSF